MRFCVFAIRTKPAVPTRTDLSFFERFKKKIAIVSTQPPTTIHKRAFLNEWRIIQWVPCETLRAALGLLNKRRSRDREHISLAHTCAWRTDIAIRL